MAFPRRRGARCRGDGARRRTAETGAAAGGMPSPPAVPRAAPSSTGLRKVAGNGVSIQGPQQARISNRSSRSTGGGGSGRVLRDCRGQCHLPKNAVPETSTCICIRGGTHSYAEQCQKECSIIGLPTCERGAAVDGERGGVGPRRRRAQRADAGQRAEVTRQLPPSGGLVRLRIRDRRLRVIVGVPPLAPRAHL